MKKIILMLFVYINSFAQTQDHFPFKYSMAFVLEQVLLKEGLPFNPKIPLPEIKLASQTSLADFQEDLKDQWSPAPEVITNVYAASKNRIYMLDDLKYYERLKRCIDDSLAHELTHYVQVQYKKYSIDQFDDSMETEAVDVQNWFREKFCPQQELD